ncbi:F-box protein [Aquicella lusitana]|nr:F-box protein [Aquicella lusitana]
MKRIIGEGVMESNRGKRRKESKKIEEEKNLSTLLGDLPDEIIQQILTFLSEKDLARLGQTSRFFSQQAGEDALWIELLKKKLKVSDTNALRELKKENETFKQMFVRVTTTSFLVIKSGQAAYDPVSMLNNSNLANYLSSSLLFETKEKADASLRSASHRGATYIVELNVDYHSAKTMLDQKKGDELIKRAVRVYPRLSVLTMWELNKDKNPNILTVVGGKEPRIINVKYSTHEKKFEEHAEADKGKKYQK